MKPICKFAGCGRASWVRGFCWKHYYQLLHSGKLPRKVLRKRKTLEELFGEGYLIDLNTGCWEWVAWFHPKGYAYIQTHRQKKVKASRFAYSRHVGDLSDGEMVLHTCDNRKCVNPAHLFKGDAKLNMLDCMAKGRATQHARAFRPKLTDPQVWNIRIMFAKGNCSMAFLAELYSVDQQTIANLLKGQTYQTGLSRRKSARNFVGLY